MTSETYDPFAQRSKEDKQREAFVNQAQQAEDVRKLMAEEWGRRLMWSWLEFCGARRTPMTGNSHTFFNCGQQNVGLMLEAQVLTHAPDAWLRMVREANEPPA